ncbi:MAG: bacteriocin [Comamonas sp.]
MTTPINPRPSEQSTDPDLAEQAKFGHGVPSQDPDAAAQVRLSPEDAERESGSVLMGGGLVAGAAAGAAVGAAIAGPAGVVVGGVVGSVAGALGGAAAGSAAVDSDPSSEAVKKQP